MKNLHIDIETRSNVDIGRSGVYRYAEADDFAILLFGYAVDGGDVRVVDLANGEKIPQKILDALTDDNIIKWAFNANFERVCLSRYLSDLGMLLESALHRVRPFPQPRWLALHDGLVCLYGLAPIPCRRWQRPRS